ncbi:MAG TPA: M20 family metallopeptidase [Verrucomicrobiae bacterium]
MTKTEKLLAELIELRSINPAFLPEEDAWTGERRVAEFIAAIAADAGLEIEFCEVLPGRPNLFARLRPAGRVRSRVWLVPHLDTVGGAEEQFTPRKRNGRFYGRGACDTKGSVAAMLSALCQLAGQKERPASTEITLVAVIDEEIGQAGSRWLAKSGLKADLAIIGEPTRLKVVTAHKGSSWLRLETRGKSAHGARPELGRNAIHLMARIVDLLETDYAAELRRRRHPLLGPPTVSVGVIRGGTQPNIVPDRCVLEVDRRTLPGETENGLRREMSRFLRKHRLSAACSSSKLAPCLPLETDPRHPLVVQLMCAARQEEPAGVHYFCDASVLARAGIPSVVFGPGDIAQAHTANEWISLAALERGTATLLGFLQSLS